MKTLKKQIQAIMGNNFSLCLENNFNADTIKIDENKAFNPASVIKLSILYAALVKVNNGQISLHQKLSYTSRDLVLGSGVLNDLSTREMNLYDLLMLMIVLSDNTATNVLIDFLGLDFIQTTIEALGLKNTYVRRKLFHMIPGVFNESTTYDTNLLLKALAEEALALKILAKQQYKNFAYNWQLCGKCHEMILSNYCTCGTYVGDLDPKEVEIYSKSGSISGHVHDAAIFVVDHKKVYVTLFTHNQDSNYETQIKLSEVGKVIYTYLKEQTC